jgi:hypothetical protein
MIVQRTRCIVSHAGSILLAWLRLATSKSAGLGAASHYSIVRNILYVIAVIVSADICVVRCDGTRAAAICLALLQPLAFFAVAVGRARICSPQPAAGQLLKAGMYVERSRLDLSS